MKNKKIIIAGGSGFIRQAISNYFGADNEIIYWAGRQMKISGNAFGKNKVD
jgi:hypothetical protein